MNLFQFKSQRSGSNEKLKDPSQYSRLNNSELIDPCLGYDDAAWAEFVARFGALIYTAVVEKLKAESDPELSSVADDIFQEVFGKLLENGCEALRNLRNRERITSWLWVISCRKTSDFLRAQRRRIVSLEPSLLARESEESRHYGKIITLETREVIQDILQGLSLQDQFILTLFYVDGRGYKEIAQMVDLPVNTVASRLHRARNKLREEAKRRGIDHIGGER